jgi:hypothetical protein
MAPDWEKLGEEWKDHAVGMIAEVDCTEESGKPLCEDYGVEGFPTLMYGDPAAPEVRNVKFIMDMPIHFYGRLAILTLSS